MTPLVPLVPLAWLSPLAWLARSSGILGLLVVAEQLLDLVPPLLQAAQRQREIGHAVPYDVVGGVPAQRHQQGPGLDGGGEAALGQRGLEPDQAVGDLHREDLAGLGEAGNRGGPQQLAAV